MKVIINFHYNLSNFVAGKSVLIVSIGHLLTRQSANTREFLSFEEFERRATTSGNMGKLVFDLIFGCHCCSISSSDDNYLAALCGIYCDVLYKLEFPDFQVTDWEKLILDVQGQP